MVYWAGQSVKAAFAAAAVGCPDRLLSSGSCRGGGWLGGWRNGGFVVSEMPEARFTRAGDVAVACQVTGPVAGLDLVFVPGWVSHLEVMWELPEFARFPDRLARWAG